MTKDSLSQEDVLRLLEDPSGETRAAVASKLASQFDASLLDDARREMIEDIFRIMVKDAEVRVREALAVNLKENAGLPHDVALSLARDVASVSLPVLQFSEILTADDLLEIVHGQDEGKRTAIAGRRHVEEGVAEALVEKGSEETVARLVANQGAEINARSLERAVDRFGHVEAVQGSLVQRAGLPVTVVERLMTHVSEGMRSHLRKHYALPEGMADDLVAQSRERATIGLSSEAGEDAVEALVRQMRAEDRLTPSIIVRAAVMGDFKFFEFALAVSAGLPVMNARRLIHDSGKLGLKSLCEKAGLPDSLFPALRAAVTVARETDYDCGENDRERYTRRMIERVLTQYGDLGVTFEGDDLEYLLGKMNQLPPGLSS